jgi:hypothetical protein
MTTKPAKQDVRVGTSAGGQIGVDSVLRVRDVMSLLERIGQGCAVIEAACGGRGQVDRLAARAVGWGRSRCPAESGASAG